MKNKGKALLWLLEVLELDAADVLPLYLGDDITDEDAFVALADFGITIFVGAPTKTAAHYVLDDTDQVGAFLRALAEVSDAHRR